jgi:hypothetical protein
MNPNEVFMTHPTDLTSRLVEAMARAIDPWAFSATSLGAQWDDGEREEFTALIERNKRDGRAKAFSQARAALTALRKAEEEVGWRIIDREGRDVVA